ncbi:MAG: two-component system sensor histidine kinase CreC [Burkholderiales bacterium]|uniref:two-component system sensor histidine kinase CreC n=1 Tax=Inhella sp. TaxID=1921806 RepID=UPI001ACDF859|nr:two-component system sensor histidine kinase CreC [Burkholderiales bacterium]
MHLGFRVLLAFFVLAGLTAWFVLRVVFSEVKPAVREVVEELLVDTAYLVAELSAEPLAAGVDGPALQRLAAQLQRLGQREVDARIWGMAKLRLDLRIYLTDAQGKVLVDTGTPSSVGQDYSAWNDVRRTLRGEYGARSSRARPEDPSSLVMQVAAPVRDAEGRLLGVASVGKPTASLDRFIARTERRVFLLGLALFIASLVLGGLVTAWLIWNVRRLRAYAHSVQAGAGQGAPQLAGELGELARAMDAMRLRLEDRSRWEQRVRALTHELKSPLTGLRGAGELLQEPLPEADRERFARQVVEQSERLQQLVERLLALSRLEAQEHLSQQPLRLDMLLQQVLDELAPRLAQRGLHVERQLDPVTLSGDPELLALMLHNLLGNAIDFAPAGSRLDISLQRQGSAFSLSLRDRGPGVPPELLADLGQPWRASVRPDGRRGSGLGLAIARQVALLHRAALDFENAKPGLRVRFTGSSQNP